MDKGDEPKHTDVSKKHPREEDEEEEQHGEGEEEKKITVYYRFLSYSGETDFEKDMLMKIKQRIVDEEKDLDPALKVIYLASWDEGFMKEEYLKILKDEYLSMINEEVLWYRDFDELVVLKHPPNCALNIGKNTFIVETHIWI